MLVIGTFQHNLELEQALCLLENLGVPLEHILVVPMDLKPEDPYHSMSLSRDAHIQAVEIGFCAATGLAVIGASIGYILAWGPLIWGIISSILGFILGFFVTSKLKQNNPFRSKVPRKPEVTVIVRCKEEVSGPIKTVMWEHKAFTVGQTVESTKQ